jgi:hypothetical protein
MAKKGQYQEENARRNQRERRHCFGRNFNATDWKKNVMKMGQTGRLTYGE